MTARAKAPMILAGDANIPAMPMTDSQVNHLRRLLAWLRCEYMLDEHMQRGFISGAALSVQHGQSTEEEARQVLDERATKINQVPAYVRQGHKMLTKALSEHDKQSGMVDECRPAENLQVDRIAAGTAKKGGDQ